MPATVSRPDPFLPVDARGDFRLVAPSGRTLNLVAQGDVLRLDAPAWDDIASATPSSFRSVRRFVRTASTALLSTGLRFELLIDGKPAFAVGTGVKPNLLSRLLGLRASTFSLRRVPVLSFLR